MAGEQATDQVVRRSEGSTVRHRWPAYVVGAAAVAMSLAWAYHDVFVDLLQAWQRNDNYSSGLLVPFLAGYVVFSRRRELAEVRIRPWYWGLFVFVLGFGMRFSGSILYYGSAERLSLVVVVIGIVSTAFGRAMARRLLWVLLFLFLMMPWPNRIHQAVSLPLQGWATTSAVFLLETFGLIVIREGNVISVGDTTVAVAEACSGLRMLTAFMVVSGLVALLCNRPLWQKAIVLASSVPIAIVCNTIRLTVTAIAFAHGHGVRVNMLFHDLGGYAMMPVALGILFAELWFMKRLVTVTPADVHAQSGGSRGLGKDGSS